MITILHSPLTFDASTFEIWAPLLNGGTLCIASPGKLSPKELGNIAEKNRVNLMFFSTGLFNVMVEKYIEAFGNVQDIIIGGDVLSSQWVAYVYEKFPKIRIHHAYGPTENTAYSTVYLAPRNISKTRSLPIGTPVANSRVYILDSFQNPVPHGAIGELYVGGDGVADGYLNVESNAFMDPLQWIKATFNEKKLYKTGDLGRFIQDPFSTSKKSVIEFLGRSDKQAKLHGFRIELEEIQLHLLSSPAVKSCALLIDREEKVLNAYIVLEEPISKATLREHLLKYLPDYMIPHNFYSIRELPITVHEKLDENALKTNLNHLAQDALPFLQAHTIEPISDTEINIYKTWKDYLKVENLGVYDNFFELGGHSLLAQRIIADISNFYDIDVELASVFTYPNIFLLARYLDKKIRESQEVDAKKIEEEGVASTQEIRPLSFQQEDFWLQERLGVYGPENNIYAGVKLNYSINLKHLKSVFVEILSRHSILRAHFFPDSEMRGKYRIRELNNDFARSIEALNVPNSCTEEKSSNLERFIKRKFNFANDLLIRCLLVTDLEQNRSQLALCAHHIICDDLSIWLVLDEMLQLLNEKILAEPLSYFDYIRHQERKIQEQALCLPVLYLKPSFQPLNFPLLGLGPAETDSSKYFIDRNLLEKLAVKYKVTSFTATLSIYYISLYYLTGSTRLLMAVPFANRNHSNGYSIIGPLAKRMFLPLECLSDNMSFEEILTEVADLVLSFQEYQNFPISKPKDSPCSIGFSYVNIEAPENAEIWKSSHNKLARDLELFLEVIDTREGNQIEMEFHFRKRLFNIAGILSFAGLMEELMKSFLSASKSTTILRILPNDPKTGVQIKTSANYYAFSNLPGTISLNSDGTDFLLPVCGQEKITHLELIPSSGRKTAYLQESLVDLSQIESTLLNFDGVHDLTIIPRYSEASKTTELCAFLVQATSSAADKVAKIIRPALERLLPSGTIAHLLMVSQIPRDENGDVNLEKLQKIPVVDEYAISSLNSCLNTMVLDYRLSPKSLNLHGDGENFVVESKILSLLQKRSNKEDHQSPQLLPKKNLLTNGLEKRHAISEGPELNLPSTAPTTLLHALKETASKHPNKGMTFIDSQGFKTFLSYNELFKRACERVIEIKRHRHLFKNYAILQFSRASDLLPVWWACLLANIVPVIVSKPTIYDTANALVDKLIHVANTLPETVIITEEYNVNNLNKLKKFPSLLKEFTTISLNLCSSFDGADNDCELRQVDPGDCAFIQLSAGSTGGPKLIEERHGSIICHVFASAMENDYKDSDVLLNWLPFDHVVPILTFHCRSVVLGKGQAE